MKRLYNGKVVCIDLNESNAHNYTVGKIYQFKDGVLTTDCGIKFGTHHPFRSFREWQLWTNSTFIEVIED
jgi:hypothetical protein